MLLSNSAGGRRPISPSRRRWLKAVDELRGGDLRVVDASPGSAVAGQLSLGLRVNATAGELSSQSLAKPTEATALASAGRRVDRAATTG
jgi:hypothetical protein